MAKLKNYLLLEMLGEGGMGAVHLARRRETGELCIVKQLRSQVARDGVVTRRFLREAQISSLLVHPNVARLIDAWREEDQLYLAMEYVPGLDLESIMNRLVQHRLLLPPALAAMIVRMVLGGLHHAHELADASGAPLGLVHRDVTPRNVMISFQGQVKIIDFGIARADVGSFRTQPGMLVGTLRYMSPEQAAAHPIDRRTDLFSCALLLFEMLIGRPLIGGDNINEILRNIALVPLPSLESLRPDLPRSLDAALSRALERQRELRFANAQEMSEALEQAARELPPITESLAQLIGNLFPERKERAVSLLLHESERQDRDEPEYLPTRAAPAELPELATIVVPESSFVDTADLADAPRSRSRRAALLIAPLLLAGMGLALLSRPAPPEPARIEPSPRPPPAIVALQREDEVEPPPEPALAPLPLRVPVKPIKIVKPEVPQSPSWDAESIALIEAGRLDDALSLLRRTLDRHQLKPELDIQARRCLREAEDHKHTPEFIATCVPHVRAALPD